MKILGYSDRPVPEYTTATLSDPDAVELRDRMAATFVADAFTIMVDEFVKLRRRVEKLEADRKSE